MLGSVRRARARGGRSPVLVALLGAASLVAALVAPLSGAGADGTTRDPFLWPFATTSPWNVPVGSGARFASDADPRTLDLQAVPGVNIDAQAYSQPMYRASTSDPLRTVTDPHGTAQYRIPDAATPAAGTDADLHVVDPTDRWVDECWNARRLPSGDLTCGYHVRTDLTGSGVTGGVRAAGVSAIGGLIRQWELDQGQIDHAVALALPDTAQAGGPIWPATAQDSDAVVAYRGHIPLGTLLAIPSSVDVTTLGLTPGGLVLAHALQDFGAYDVDSTGEGVPGALYADPSADTDPVLAQMRHDAATLVRRLRAVTNNSLVAVGGGGTVLAPLAPVLAATSGATAGAASIPAPPTTAAPTTTTSRPGAPAPPRPAASSTVSPPPATPGPPAAGTTASRPPLPVLAPTPFPVGPPTVPVAPPVVVPVVSARRVASPAARPTTRRTRRHTTRRPTRRPTTRTRRHATPQRSRRRQVVRRRATRRTRRHATAARRGRRQVRS